MKSFWPTRIPPTARATSQKNTARSSLMTTAKTWRKANASRSGTPPANSLSSWMPTTKSPIADYIELAVKALGGQSAGARRRKLLSAVAENEFVLRLPHASAAHQRSDCWLMSANPKLVARDGEVERWTLPGDSLFLSARRERLCFSPRGFGIREGGRTFSGHARRACTSCAPASANGCGSAGAGVHHYYVQTLWGFVQKRRRATVHFLRVQEEAKTNWMKEKPPVPLWLAAVYCVTFIGPLWHTLRGVIRDRDARWLWHVPACLGQRARQRLGRLDLQTRGQDKKLVANLKPKQTLK